MESTWSVPASAAAVWDLMSQVDGWSSWWPGMRSSHLLHAEDGASGVGSVARCAVRSPLVDALTFTLALTATRPPLDADVSVDGDLRGIGSWRSQEAGGSTRIHITWCVTTRRWPLRVLRPVGRAGHRLVMQQGGAGLGRALVARG